MEYTWTKTKKEAVKQQDSDAEAMIAQTVREMARDNAAAQRARGEAGSRKPRYRTRIVDRVGQTMREIFHESDPFDGCLGIVLSQVWGWACAQS